VEGSVNARQEKKIVGKKRHNAYLGNLEVGLVKRKIRKIMGGADELLKRRIQRELRRLE